MLDSSHPLAELLRRDDRYRFDAYVFVFDALRYAQEKLDMGRVVAGGPRQSRGDDDSFEDQDFESAELEDEVSEDEDLLPADADESGQREERHVTGQELCEAMRRFALEQYGLLARSVLSHWGVRSTGDFGEIVFNLIDIGQMRKTEHDRREDFDDVYDFEEAWCVEAVFAATADEESGE